MLSPTDDTASPPPQPPLLPQVLGPALPRVSLEVIAERLHVSKATVCRALRGQPGVSKALKDRIVETAKRLGYRPDPGLSALAGLRWQPGKARTIPFAIAAVHVFGSVPDNEPAHRGPHHNRTGNAQRRCDQFGIHYDEFWLTDNRNSKALGRMLKERGFHGVLFSVEGPTVEWNFPFEWFSCVGLGFETAEHTMHRVCPDYQGAIELAVEEAEARGYRQIGFLRFLHSNPQADNRIGAAMELCRHQMERKYGPQPEIFTYPLDGEYTDLFGANEERFHRWRETQRPDILIDANRIGYWWLRESGIRMPEEIGYISCMDRPVHPKELGITLAELRYHLQAQWATDFLINLIQTGTRGLSAEPIRIVVPCAWVESKTLRPRPNAPAP